MIRPIIKSDIPACLAIYNTYVLQTAYTLEEEAVTLSDFTGRVHRIASNYVFYVLVEKDRVLGYAYLDDFNPRSAYRITCDLSLYLSMDARGKGYGKMLLEVLQQYAKKHGLRNIISIVTTENTGSIAFHEKQGFHLQGTFPDVAKKFGRMISVCYYQKIL